MKKHTTIKRLSALALALALVMALVPAAPAMAATDKYQVQIHPNDYTSIPTNGNERVQRFKAYQIFKGVIDEKYQAGDPDPVTSELPTNDQPIANELSEVQWGDSIPATRYGDLLSALILEPTFIKDMEFTVDQLADLLFKAGERYYQARGLEYYKEAYENPKNWEPKENGETEGGETGGEEGEIGGTLKEGVWVNTLKPLLLAAIPELTFGDLLEAALRSKGYEVFDGIVTEPSFNPDGLTLGDSAEMITWVLQDFTNSEKPYSRDFAEDFAKKVGAKKDDGSYAYLYNPVVSGWSSSGYWTIDLPEGGYYFIIDEYADEDDDKAQSDFIVAVFGTQHVFVKSQVPTVDMVIVDGDSGNPHGDDFEIGEEITFRITGTLPENYGNYDSYAYSFTNTMDAGLSYKSGSMEVYAVAPDGTRYQLEPGDNLTLTDFTDSNIATIKFTDLKKITSGTLENNPGRASGTDEFTITKNWKIVVEYKATLNQGATFRNENRVFLTYSSSVVNSGSTANTTQSVDYIYTFGIDIWKYYEGLVDDPEKDVSEKSLEGAGFALTKDDNGTQYALFDENGSLCGWISESNLKAYFGVTDDIKWDDNDNAILKAVKDGNGILDGEYAGKHIYFVTNDDGEFHINDQKVYFKGLKAGTDYTLNEIIVPDGYDKPEEEMTVQFTAKYYDPDPESAENDPNETDPVELMPGKLVSLSCEVLGDGGVTEVKEGVANLELINYPTDALLDTGGMGTALFYISGSALLVGAALILIFANVKKKPKKHIR